MSEQGRKGSLAKLSEKRREALALVAAGYTSKEAALQLDISPRSFDERIEGACRHLGVSTRVEAARIYRTVEGDPERLRGEPLRVGESSVVDAWKAQQPVDRHLHVSDALIFDQRASWHGDRRGLRPGIKPSDLGVTGKLLAIVGGAIALLAVAILLVTSASALGTLFGV